MAIDIDLKSLARNIVPPSLRFLTDPPHIHQNGVIDSLKAKVGEAGQQSPARFRVDFTPPPALISGSTASGKGYTELEMQIIRTYCFSVVIPSASYLTYDWVSKGVPIKVPYQKAYSDLTTNHYVDVKGIVRSFFQDWHELIMDNDTQNFEFMENYLGSVLIKQYDTGGTNDENITAQWYIDGLWPTILGQESLAFDANDALLSFDVTWTYNIMQLTKRQKGK